MIDQKKICPNCQGNGFVKTHKSDNPANDTVMQCTICNSKGELRDKEFDEYFESTLCLSHCAISTTDMVNIGAAIYTGIEDDR